MAQATRTVQQGAQAMGQSFTSAANASTKANEAWRQSMLTTTQTIALQVTQLNAHQRALQQSTAQVNTLVQAATGLAGAFAGQKLLGFLQDVTLTAARTETLGVVLNQVAKNMDVTSLEAGTARDRIKALGVTTQEASLITARFIQTNLGLENAIKLANVARNAAVLADQNTSQALAGLVQGILTMQQETLRTYGIFVNLSKANEDYAKSVGRTVESLSTHEKQQVALNAVIEAGVAINGTYEAALGTVGKQVTSLTRVVEESKNVLGNNYLPIFGQLVKAATDLLVAFQSLPQPIQTAITSILGAATAVGVLTVAIAALVRVGQALAISSLFTGWGVVILAIGAATAAAIALSKALGAVGQTDPATVLKQSLSAIDSRIATTQNLLSAQESSLAVMQKQLTQTPESKAGAEIIARQTQRVDELRKALETLQKVREQVGKPVPLPPPKPEPPESPAAPKVGSGTADAAARARALVALQQQEIRLEAEKLNQLQAMRNIALEQDRDAAISSSSQTKSELDQIERAFAIRRLDVTRLGVQEDMALQVKAAQQARDAKLAALDAEVADSGVANAKTQAEAEAHSKKLAAIAVQRQTAEVDYQADLVEIAKKRAESEAAYIKGVSSLEKAARLEQMRLAEQVASQESQLQQQTLQSRATGLDAEKALVQAQVDGLVLTREEGLAQTQAIEDQALEIRRAQLNQAFAEELRLMEKRVAEEGATQDQITQLRANHELDLAALDNQQAAQQLQHRNELLRGWIDWVKDVQGALGNFLFEWMDGQVDSIKDVLESLKSYFFRILAEMVAKAAVSAIVIPIVTSVLGGAGGGEGGASGLLGGLGQAASITGILGKLFGLGGGAEGGGLFGLLRTPLDWFKQQLFDAGDVIQGLFGVDGTVPNVFRGFASDFSTYMSPEGLLAESALPPEGAAAAFWGQVAGVAGGLTALGTGIYAALNASNAAAKAAYSLSAAAGAAATATAAYGAIMGAAVVTAGGTGWTGIGLVVAAVMAIIGTVLDKVIKPEGPSLSVRSGAGLNIGTAAGKLQVQGDLGSRVTRREGVDRGLAEQVQQQLEAGITNAVLSIVQTINAVALDPAALVGPTQDALQKALKNLQPINTANAKKMEKDIAEQLRFANVAIVGGLLEPLNLAFDQLRDQGDLTQQLDRLPGTTAGLVAVFKTMNEQLDEIAKSENTDVLRQLSSVRNQVENFGNRIAGTAGQIAEQVVTGIIDSFRVQVDADLSGQITQFSGLLNSSIRALGLLRNTRQTLEQAGLGGGAVGGQIDRLMQATGEMSARISTAIVSTALSGLAADLDRVLIQPIRIQATTVNSLFTESLAALQALQVAWQQLNEAGIDSTGIQQQFTRLLGGMIESAFTVITQSFTGGSFAEFLGVLLSIPEALTALNPTLQALQNMGKAFASVVSPIEQVIETQQNEMRTTEERIAFTAHTMAGLRDAIASVGTSVEAALPLYAKLGEQIQANAAAQIDAANEVAQQQIEAAQASADAQIQAIRDASDTSLEAIHTMVDESTQAVNGWADAWTMAINETADHAIQSVRDLANGWTTAINEAADAQIQGIHTWADAWTTAINDAIDQQRDLLAEWVQTMTEAVNTWAETAQTTAGQLRTVTETIRGESSPAVQRQALLEDEARLLALAASGGPGSQAAMSELIRVEQQLLALAKQSDDLKRQKESLDKLEAIRKYLQEQLIAQTGQSDPILAQIAVAVEQEKHLAAINAFNEQYSRYLSEVQALYLKDIADQEAAAVAAITLARDAQIEAIGVARDVLVTQIEATRDAYVHAVDVSREAQIQMIGLASDEQTRVAGLIADAQIKAIEDQRDATIDAIEDQRDAVVRAIKEDLVYQLSLVQYELQKLFVIQYKALTGQDLPTPAQPVRVVTTPAPAPRPPVILGQQGRLMGLVSGAYAQGGMVHAMLEPGERVYGPMNRAQQGALMAVNQAFPRFANGGMVVPGSGSGDTVPAMLSTGSLVLNRRASAVLDRVGMQTGGQVHPSTTTVAPVVNIHIAKLEVRNDADIKAIIDGITKQLRREWRSPNDTGPFR